MAQTADGTLERRIADLEAQVRSMRATNLTDLASVVDASGNSVPLSGLAFGQVSAENPAVGAVSLTSTANVATSGQDTDPMAWTYLASPILDVLVKGGRMRVDWAAVLAANANQTASPEISMSYQVLFRGPSNDGTVNTRVVNPSRYRCIKIVNYGASPRVESYGTFAFHTGLAPGWYRVQTGFYLAYQSSTTTVTCSADYPRLAATPF
jgi:hypothetical protein